MKKIYLICSLVVILGITAGISFFLIRDSSAQVPSNISLVTQNNEEYRFGEQDKKMKLVEFIYTHCPDICPTTTQKMNSLKADLKKAGVFGDEIEFLTITIDPYNDTPEVLKSYMNSFEIDDDGNWIFLTGDKKNIKEELQDIQQVANAFQFQYRDPGNGFFVHSSFTFLIDENNHFIEKFPMGDEFDKNKVYETIMEEIN